MTKNISDIFLSVMASDVSFVDLRILIEGAPGIGKTVLAKEIAYRWAENELLTSKKLLFLVFLRECFQKPVMTIEGLIQFVFKSSEMTSCLTKHLTKTEGKDTVIIFDGFDELSEENKKGSIIVDIINRRILTKCCLVVTSRPTASSILHKSVDRRVEIVGFTEEDRLDYIQTALGSDDKQVNGEHVNNERVIALQHYLQSNPTINALCYIPLNMTILLCLVEDGIDKLPKTQTEMYKKFIEMTIVRFIKKYDKSNTIIDIAELLDPYDKLFVELSKLAYKALETDKIVFTLPEIKEGCPNLTMTSSNWNGLGLLKAVQCFSMHMGNDQVTFHFLHFSIQEYMAAWYISTLSDGDQIKLLQKTFWENRYYNTWIMYVGITGGSSFGLKHFLSGNWFQLYSKLFRSSKVSKTFLKHKMKCLHLFQCLLEANKEDVIKSVKQLFENNRIDLSNQTLLPSDLNTLGFFLIRSVNKQWDELDLSNCNIGSNGSNVLCDRLLDKDARGIVTIKLVKFSYNQLNFTSLIRLFGLFKCWHTSEIIIADHVTHDVRAIENVVLQSSSTLALVLIGPCLFCKNTKSSKILDVLSNANIRSIYLLNCSWMSNDSETTELFKMLGKQLNKVRIIGSSLNEFYILTLASRLLSNNSSVNMLVYNPTMSDQTADDISSFILSSYKDASGVVLIVSRNKIQGIVNTCSLTNELSALERFNLSMYVRHLNSKLCTWKEHLESQVHNKDFIFTFIKLLYKTDFNWKLKITLWENDILIVHRTEFENLDESIYLTNNISIVYLSSCNINEKEYDAINETCSTLHILNSPDCVQLLHAKLLLKQSGPNELFIYGNIKYTLMDSLIELLSHDHLNISAVLAVNGIIVGIHPSNELIALAFQLQPSPTTWILSTTDNISIFYQVIDVLTVLPTEWIELDFTGCNIGDIECDIMYRTFRCKKCSTVRKLSINLSRLSISGICDLVNIVITCGIKKLNITINGINDVLLDYFINNLTFKQHSDMFLSMTHNHKVLQMICNKNLNKVAAKLNTQVSELHIINCKEQNSTEVIDYLHMTYTLQRLCIINCSISEEVITEIIQIFLNRNIEVTISNDRIIDDDRVIRNFLTSREFFQKLNLNFVLSTDHLLYVYNITKYQLQIIDRYFMNKTQLNSYTMTRVIRNFEKIYGDKMYSFEKGMLIVVRFHAKAFQVTGATKIIAALCNSTSLNIIEIENYNISDKNVDKLAAVLHHNPQLRELHLNRNKLQTNNAIKIIKALHSVVTLTKFSLCYDDITDEAADDIAAAISCNTQLKEFDVSGNDLRTLGVVKIAVALQSIVTLINFNISNNNITCTAAKAIAVAITHNSDLKEFNISGNSLEVLGATMIARSLQKVSTLTKLYINNNKITDEAADDIAAAISCNNKLRDINISGNNLHTIGAMKIIKALQGIHMLKVLYLNNNKITFKAADDIATAIQYSSELHELDVGNNMLQTEGIKKIVKSLQGSLTLIKLDISNNNMTDEAADDIATAISCNTGLQELNINGNDFKTSGAIIIAKSLQKVSTLTRLYMDSNNITDGAADDISAAISCNLCLKEFTIARNDLQTLGAIKIAKGLQNITALIKLHIHINNITQHAADDIAAAISCNTQLEELDVSGNNLQEMGVVKIAKTLQNIHTLKKLNINNNNITDGAADDIAAVIYCNVQLIEFGISGNDLTEGVIKIAVALQGIVTLIKLNISNNNITCTAANAIAVAITQNTYLQEFIISGSCLNVLSATLIAKSLHKISMLTKLYIANTNISSDEADNIAAAVSCNIHLQEFDIGRNNLQALGATIITRSLQKISRLTKLYMNNNNITSEAADDIAAAIICNTQLQEFDVSGNNLRTEGVVNIVIALQRIVTLTKLNISNNNITWTAADDIAAAIICNTQLQEFDVSGNDLGTKGVEKIVIALQRIDTLTKLNISNNNITWTAANAIAVAITHNTYLQEFIISGNCLEVFGTIAKSLHKISMITKLCIANINICDKAAYDIADAVSCNTYLQELNIGRNNLQALGAAQIARGLQKISTLRKFYIDNNSITYEAADDIAAAIQCSSELCELDVGNNKFQTQGIRKIVKSLQGSPTLIKLDISNNSVTDEAADDIATAISCNTGLQELNINGNDFKTSGAIIIAKSLQKVSTLTKLYMDSNNITDGAADDISAAISFNPCLKEFTIARNNLQTLGSMKIAEGLQTITALTKLHIHINNITQHAADDIAAAISCNTQLEELDVSGSNLQEMGVVKIAKILQHIHTLKKLNINNNKITDRAADDIAAAIHCNTKLEEVNVSGNDLRTGGVIKIAVALKSIVTLTKLNICNNNITSTAANAIAVVITYNIHLQEFNISENGIGVSGAKTIANSLQKNSTLIKLYIAKTNINDEVADDIAAVVSCNVHLQEFDISGNCLQAFGATKIVRGLQEISTLTKLYINKNKITYEAAGEIAAAISCNSKLQDIDISENDLETTGTIKIMKALQRSYKLKILYLNSNNITGEAADDIAAAIRCNTKLKELDVSGNDLRAKGIEKIVIALQSIVTLAKLNISNNNVEANATAVAISHNTHLQEFIISENNLGVLSATMIARNLQKISTLTKLYIAGASIGDGAADDIATAVSCNVHLQEFDISKNYLQASSVIKVAKGLRKISTLTKLCINNNQITNEAAGYIANVISCNSHLQILDISSNSLQAQGATIILKSLQKISSLTTLCINYNIIAKEVADDIAAVVSCNPMQVLDVSNNCLGTIGITKVAKALQSICTLTHLYISNNNITDEATDDIAAAISCNLYLEEFDISYNSIEGRGAIKIAKSFQQISTLKKLFMDHNKITDEASDDIAAVIRCNPRLKNKFRINGNKLTTLTIL